MFDLLGIALTLAGDALLVGHLSGQKKKSLVCLSEMIDFLREVTCLVYDFKLPLEEALRQQAKQGEFANLLWENVIRSPETGIRTALLKAIQELPLPEASAKQLLTEYFRRLGNAPKETVQDHYRGVQKQLKALYETKKEEFHKANRLSAGAVYGISLVTAILLW